MRPRGDGPCHQPQHRTLPTELGYSRQNNRKTDEGSHHPDRNSQFDYINAELVAAQVAHQPQLIQRKKDLLATIATPAATTGRRAIPNGSKCMTSRRKTSARSRLMECTTSPPMDRIKGEYSGSELARIPQER